MHDFRAAIRTLRVTPILTSVAILSLALGIGANTVIFSIVNSLFIRQLPIAQPERLAIVSDARLTRPGFVELWTYGIWQQIRARAGVFDGACASWNDRLSTSTGTGEAAPLAAMWVTGEYFSVIGVTPMLGRPITGDDDEPAAPQPVAVISYRFWQQHFGGSAAIVGMPIAVERVPFTIVGVAPPEFVGTSVGRSFDVALPLAAERLVRGKDTRLAPERSFYGLSVFVRLKPTQSIENATALLRAVQPQIREAAMPPSLPTAFRSEFMKDPFTVLPAATGTSGLRATYERPLTVIGAVVATVLLIACANIANLQFARGLARRHELSVRVALGATRAQLVRALMIESLLLAGTGSVLGLLFAQWSGPIVVAQLSSAANRIYLPLILDWRVLIFTAAVTVTTTIVFGVAPALRASDVAPIEALKRQLRGQRTATTPAGMSDALVVGQVALSLAVVAAAALFVRTFENLAARPLGFDADRIAAIRVNTQHAGIPAGQRYEFVRGLAESLTAVPGVERTAVSMNTPVGGGGLVDIVYSSDVPPGQALAPMVDGRLGKRATFLNFVTPGWFAAYGTPLRRGRDFSETDMKTAPAVVIVNESFVRKFLDGREPVGATIGFDRGHGAPVLKTIVGVVADAVYQAPRFGDEPVEYAPLAQLDFPVPPALDAAITVRAAAGSPEPLFHSVAAAIAAANRDLTYEFHPLRSEIDTALTDERAIAVLSTSFAVLALLLAAVGLYGITAHAVAERQSEIAIRLALGAPPVGVARLIGVRIGTLVILGIAGGSALTLWAGRYLAPLLFGLTTYDPGTYVLTAVILLVAATAAAAPEVHHAMRVDPADVLRES